MDRSTSRSRPWLAALMLLSLAPTPALAQDDCTGFLPDFRCERSPRFEGFSLPLAAGFHFEDPFITTGVIAWGLINDMPRSSVFGGGSVRATAVQARVALTDRLAFIATQDGYVSLRPELDILDTERGFLDLMAGFKYALIYDPDRRLIVTPALRYKTTNGTRDILSGNGEGIWIPSVSLGWGPGPLHVIADVGAHLPVDGQGTSQFWFWDLHVGFPVTPKIIPFAGVSAQHYTSSGDGNIPVNTSLGVVPLRTAYAVVAPSGRLNGSEGNDLLNIGSRNVDGNDVVTWTVGMELLLNEQLRLGMGYTRPLTHRRDLLKQRFTLRLSFEL